jgi:acid phosphatase type 7
MKPLASIGLAAAGMVWPWCVAEVAADEAEVFGPPGILLTWQRDPTTTMTIDWHSTPETGRPRPPVLLYRELGAEDEAWKEAPGTMHPFPFTDRTISRVELTGLTPDTEYEFRFGPPPGRYAFPESRVYRFRTMPEQLEREVRIGVGGDNGSGAGFRRVNAQAMAHEVDFIVIGGDLAYADGGARDWMNDSDGMAMRRWVGWFEVVKETLITEEGRVVPILAGIGNHEVWLGEVSSYPDYEQTDVWRERLAPIYYNIFAFPGQPGYGVLDFGDYLSFILLDSNHTNPVAGEQTEWLGRVLAERSEVPHVFPIYHVPAYPSIRAFDASPQRDIREHWAPLFEKHGVEIAFENHDHVYKRTHPIRAGQVDPEGVVYIGDGAWGMIGSAERMYDVETTWYLKKAAAERHFILVTLDESGRRLTMINDAGEVIDRFPEE